MSAAANAHALKNACFHAKVTGAWNVPSPLPFANATLPVVRPITRSTRPSLSKSPAATPKGRVPAPKFATTAGAAKNGSHGGVTAAATQCEAAATVQRTKKMRARCLDMDTPGNVGTGWNKRGSYSGIAKDQGKTFGHQPDTIS